MDEQIGRSETAALEGLKVVVSIREGRAIIGVQRSSADPHIGSFNDSDASGLTREVMAVVEKARAKWEDAPKYPAHERLTPQARRRSQREQGSGQVSTAEDGGQPQPEALRLAGVLCRNPAAPNVRAISTRDSVTLI